MNEPRDETSPDADASGEVAASEERDDEALAAARAIDEAVLTETRESLAALLTLFWPEGDFDDQWLTQRALEHTVEQRQLREEMIPQLSANRERRPIMGVKIWPRGMPDAGIDLYVHKDPEQCVEPAFGFNYAGYFAFLLTPAARALLRALGYDYRFVEIEKKPDLTIIGGGR